MIYGVSYFVSEMLPILCISNSSALEDIGGGHRRPLRGSMCPIERGRDTLCLLARLGLRYSMIKLRPNGLQEESNGSPVVDLFALLRSTTQCATSRPKGIVLGQT